MTPFRFLALSLALSATAFAQQFSHPVTATRDHASSLRRDFLTVPDTVRVLAVMVQFQQDNDAATSGDGHFDLTAPTDSIVDPPPRNGSYFRDHLTFLGNYYRKASKGKLAIRWTLVDSVYGLPGRMSTYSPPKNGPNTAVANLARDTWREVDSSGRVPDFSRYDCFIVFHAGVGRDIDLVGTLGYDPTPFDIPSLYIGPKAFTDLLGGGIPVNGGAFTITNTVILPETESRLLPGLSGDVLLELGVNGLLCASVGNYLGLPDLFNTKTGRSGIGRFGLMDGQAIFSFYGLFPPEPSAWEKYYLGWVQPVTVPPGTSTLPVPAVELADTVYRIPVSDGEYFLLENRNRDPDPQQHYGQRVFSTFNGVARQQFFARDTTGFNAFDISGLSGTVTDVEDMDWSLPGGVDPDGTFYDGGMLIWHIDEAVIAQSIATDAVNANPARRGVDLEEADGSQDIGQNYGLFTAGSGSEEGTPLDFWFKGNNSPVNKNEFSATTFPNTNSNLGAFSHVTVSDFLREPGSRMKVTVVRGDAVSPLNGYPRQTGEGGDMLALTDTTVVIGTNGVIGAVNTASGIPVPPRVVGGKLYLLPAGQGVYREPFRGIAATTSSTSRGFAGTPAIADLNRDGTEEAVMLEASVQGSPGYALRAFSLRDLNADSLADPFFSTSLPGALSAAPVISDSLIALGFQNGGVYFLRFSGSIADSIGSPAGQVSGGTIPAGVGGISLGPAPNSFTIAYEDGTLRMTTRTPGGGRADLTRRFDGRITSPASTGRFDRKSDHNGSPTFLTAFVTTDGVLYLVDSTFATVHGFPVATGDSLSGPVPADIDGDGMVDIVVFGRQKIYAFNVAGASLDHFPVTVPGVSALRTPLVGDVDGDGRVDIVGTSTDGLALAYARDGKPAPGFPLVIGTGEQSAALATNSGMIILVTASSDGSVSAWMTGRYAGPLRPELYPWPQSGKDARHSGFDSASVAGTPVSSQFLPKERAYNWPNPAYSGKTFIRYFVAENATVSIKIFDLAGDLVTELRGQGIGGVDNEVAWDVSGVQSGIYFARIEAEGQGQSGAAVIKVAVVK